MTHPTDVKPREGDHPGTFAGDFWPGTTLPELRFTVSPEIIKEYVAAVAANPDNYRCAGRQAAPPTVLAVYLLAVIYRQYPPAQGIILAKQSWEFHDVIWADEDTELIARGTVLDVQHRRTKDFVSWSAEFKRPNGQLVASARNEFYVPAPEEASLV
jgi:hypothetical protein